MDNMANFLQKMDDADQAVSFQGEMALRQACHQAMAPGRADHARKIGEVLAEELNATKPAEKPDDPEVIRYSTKTRQKILRYLSLVGGDGQLDVLKQSLDDLQLREMARYALERNPSSQATELLIAALEKAGPLFRIGVIGSLSKRGGDRAVKALRQQAQDSDPAIQKAANDGLRKIHTNIAPTYHSPQ